MIELGFALVVLGTAAAVWFYLDRPPCLSQRVIVNLSGDPETAYNGVLWRSRGSWIVLKDVRAMRSDGKVTVVDGETVFPRGQILFMQVPPGER